MTIQINEVYRQLMDLPVRVIDCYGGRDSGKSVWASQYLTLKGAQHPRRIVVMRKTATTILKSVWERMKAAFSDCGIEYEQNKTERTLTTPMSQYWFIGADDPEKLKSIEGVTDYWLEEATEFVEADFDTLNIGLRARVDPPCQIVLTHNPIPVIPGYEFWIQRRFLRVEHALGEAVVRDNTAVLRSYYRHNAFISSASRDELERLAEINPQLYRMWGLGEFAALEGVILDGNWDIVESLPERVPLIGNGVDFGFAHDPAAVVRVWGDPKREIWIRECVYETGLLDRQLSERMSAEGLERSDVTVCDAAEPKARAGLQELGWSVMAGDKGPDYKRAAAQNLRSLKIHILEGSTNCVKEVSTWSWKRDRRGNVLPIPEDGNDHCIDALIYLLGKFTRSAPKTGKQTAKRQPVTAGYRRQKW